MTFSRRLFAVLACALGAASCADDITTDPTPGSSNTAELAGGSSDPGRMKGAVEIVDRRDGTICSGVLISTDTLLTSAGCIKKYIPANQTTFDAVRMFDVYLTGWDLQRKRYWKRCISEIGGGAGPEEGTCVPYSPGENGKAMKLDIFSASLTDVNNDLGMITFRGYKWFTTTEADYADLYIGIVNNVYPQLQLHAYGNQGTRSAPGNYHTGKMNIASVNDPSVVLTAGQVRSCTGDRGGAWAVPQQITNGDQTYGNAVVAIHHGESSIQAGCAVAGTTVNATRIKTKMTWIQGVLASYQGEGDNPEFACQSTDASNNVKRCYAQNCNPALPEDPDGWAGCRAATGGGCAVCYEGVSGYSRYFTNHPACARALDCGAARSRCSRNCPVPTADDL